MAGAIEGTILRGAAYIGRVPENTNTEPRGDPGA